jgi:hypothetical protein
MKTITNKLFRERPPHFGHRSGQIQGYGVVQTTDDEEWTLAV